MEWVNKTKESLVNLKSKLRNHNMNPFKGGRSFKKTSRRKNKLKQRLTLTLKKHQRKKHKRTKTKHP
jgi:hypothetical protein